MQGSKGDSYENEMGFGASSSRPLEIANDHELQTSVAGLLRRARILADKDGSRLIGSAAV